MKNFKNYGVVSLDNREVKKTDGGTTCPSGYEYSTDPDQYGGAYSYSAQWAVGWLCGLFGL